MPGVVRIGDELSTGHGCMANTTLANSNQGVDNVYANNILISVKGADTVAHPFPPDPPCNPHVAQLTEGSSTVKINNIEVGRIGDNADAGAMSSGSTTVFAGP